MLHPVRGIPWTGTAGFLQPYPVTAGKSHHNLHYQDTEGTSLSGLNTRRPVPGSEHLVVIPNYSPVVGRCSFLDGSANLGTQACDEDTIPPFPRPRAAVGGEVRIGRFSFTDDPREEGMSRGW